MASGDDQNEQPRTPNPQEASRRNSLSRSLKRAKDKMFGTRNSPPRLKSYFPEPRQGEQLHDMHSRSGNWQAPGNAPQQSVHGQQPLPGGFHRIAIPTRPRLGDDTPAAQQQLTSQNSTSTSRSQNPLPQPVQNMTTPINGYGTSAQQPHQGYNGGHYQTGLNVHAIPTHPHHGLYQPSGPYTSTPQMQPPLHFIPILPASNVLHNTDDVAARAGCYEHWKSFTHVVGSQGRRGRLPTSEGFSEPPSPLAFEPSPNSDGRFPCPSCKKTYLHKKHLKRHLLRHTNSRPYICPLCTDTFGRPDILKRHYKKCATRSGKTVEPGDHLKLSAQQNKYRSLPSNPPPQEGSQANGHTQQPMPSRRTAYQQRTPEPENGYTERSTTHPSNGYTRPQRTPAKGGWEPSDNEDEYIFDPDSHPKI